MFTTLDFSVIIEGQLTSSRINNVRSFIACLKHFGNACNIGSKKKEKKQVKIKGIRLI
jgi:hypothetical protein